MSAISPTSHNLRSLHTSTQQRRNLRRIRILRDAHRSLGANGRVLAIASLTKHAVDGLVIAHLEPPATTILARRIVPAMPSSADPVTDLPLRLPLSDSDDVAYVFVAETFDLADACITSC